MRVFRLPLHRGVAYVLTENIYMITPATDAKDRLRGNACCVFAHCEDEPIAVNESPQSVADRWEAALRIIEAEDMGTEVEVPDDPDDDPDGADE